MADPVLSIRDLTVEFDTDDGVVHAVDGVSYDVYPGETLGIVGESGSGKSVSTMSLLGLIPQPPGRVVSGEAIFDGRDLLKMKTKRAAKIRGGADRDGLPGPDDVAEPGAQGRRPDREAIETHGHGAGRQGASARDRAARMVGIPNPEQRYDQYPHEFSGGMRQRAMIAMAIANEPKLLIADEPTTALDVTIQAQILEVLKKAQDETHAATILITHDLGLIAELADRVIVMYAGGSSRWATCTRSSRRRGTRTRSA